MLQHVCGKKLMIGISHNGPRNERRSVETLLLSSYLAGSPSISGHLGQEQSEALSRCLFFPRSGPLPPESPRSHCSYSSVPLCRAVFRQRGTIWVIPLVRYSLFFILWTRGRIEKIAITSAHVVCSCFTFPSPLPECRPPFRNLILVDSSRLTPGPPVHSAAFERLSIHPSLPVCQTATSGRLAFTVSQRKSTPFVELMADTICP